jgi:diphosphate--fructose-6-phosphate 1-phosphotransferase
MGGMAAGGHDVIAGLFDALSSTGSQVIGFLDGPKGLFDGGEVVVDRALVDRFRGQGGFHMIGSGRYRIEGEATFAKAAAHCERLGLGGLVIVGGDGSNTSAAFLAEHFEAHGCRTRVVGVPKTIDGDLKAETVETSFGFETASRTFSECIGNIGRDTLSSRKYHHFVRLMGRSASHVTLECALQAGPNLCLIGEEVEAKHRTLASITNEVADLVVERWRLGMDYSLIVLSEGLVEFIPEMNVLIGELNALGADLDQAEISARLSPASRPTFDLLPSSIRTQLLLERDPQGQVQVSRIETERLLMLLVATELHKRKDAGTYGGKFKARGHFFGYEGRSGLPSVFDSDYGYWLGDTAARILGAGRTGYIATLRNVAAPTAEWLPGAVPLTSLMVLDKKGKPVVRRTLVDLEGRPFKAFEAIRAHWRTNDCYRSPGPIQFHGATADDRTYTLLYEQGRPFDPYHVPESACVTTPLPSNKFFPTRSSLHCVSLLDKERLAAAVELPPWYGSPLAFAEAKEDLSFSSTLSAMFPLVGGQVPLSGRAAAAETEPAAPRHRVAAVGVAFFGRQCPGAHNVVAGLVDRASATGGRVLGFLGGSEGLQSGEHVEVTQERIAFYRNLGGFDLLGRTEDQIGSPAGLEAVKRTCLSLGLDGLVLLGGSKTVPSGLEVAEYLAREGCPTRVVVVPATVDGDVICDAVEVTVGFDTATRMYSQVIGNMAMDCLSAKKYYYFVRLMGRGVSHVALECALRVNPNLVIIGEEVAAKNLTLADITSHIADVVCARAEQGKDYGVILLPEGLINRFPEFSLLIKALAERGVASDADAKERLAPWQASLFLSLPPGVRGQLVMERESDGSVQLSQIDTEKLLISTVEAELGRRRKLPGQGAYRGKFSAVGTFFGYQARCSVPSAFDCSLASSLGAAAWGVIAAGRTGYLVSIPNVCSPVECWGVTALPLSRAVEIVEATALGGASTAALDAVAPVDMAGPGMTLLKQRRVNWRLSDLFLSPGPIQFEGLSARTRPEITMITCTGASALSQRVADICRHIVHLSRSLQDQDCLADTIEKLESVGETLTAAVKKSVSQSV